MGASMPVMNMFFQVSALRVLRFRSVFLEVRLNAPSSMSLLLQGAMGASWVVNIFFLVTRQVLAVLLQVPLYRNEGPPITNSPFGGSSLAKHCGDATGVHAEGHISTTVGSLPLHKLGSTKSYPQPVPIDEHVDDPKSPLGLLRKIC